MSALAQGWVATRPRTLIPLRMSKVADSRPVRAMTLGMRRLPQWTHPPIRHSSGYTILVFSMRRHRAKKQPESVVWGIESHPKYKRL